VCSSGKIAPFLNEFKLPMLLARDVDVFAAKTAFLKHVYIGGFFVLKY
jgi:hypothetical protein